MPLNEPIRPDELPSVGERLPDDLVGVVNLLIRRYWDGQRALFWDDAVRQEVRRLKTYSPGVVYRDAAFTYQEHWRVECESKTVTSPEGNDSEELWTFTPKSNLSRVRMQNAGHSDDDGDLHDN